MIEPLEIGNVRLPNNLILAPMAGVTDGPFRRVCRKLGAGLTVSELASAKGILIGTRQTSDLVRFQGEMRPYSVQIFGADPETMAEAARIVESLNVCDMLDINMGCPVSKVVKTGAGAALMKTPELAARIVASVKRSVKLPVTAKFRLGWTHQSINVREFTRMAVDQGAAAITVHARTKEDGYSGTAHWKYLEGLQDVCGKVPFIANGDIHIPEDLTRLHEISGCQGFMIGRGAVGNPWKFAELIRHFAPELVTGDLLSEDVDRPEMRFRVFCEHFVETLMEHGGKGVLLFRVHLFNYLRGHPNASNLRRKLCFERNPRTVLRVGKDFFLGGGANDDACAC